jgi:Kef-type K+ transport system membrane component KefB
MSETEFGGITFTLLALLAGAHLLGSCFVRLHQPRVVGEILAGVLLGPAVLGRFFPNLSFSVFLDGTADHPGNTQLVFGFLYNLGLLLLMFISGAGISGFVNKQDRRAIAWLGLVGTGLPFVAAFLFAPLVPLTPLMGAAGQKVPLLLVISIAMAVTSIPVISKIFHDLHLLHTRFARLILGVAMFEDIVLWSVLALALALSKSVSVSGRGIAYGVAAAAIYFSVGIGVMPRLLRWAGKAEWNLLAKKSPSGYVIAVILAFASVASLLGVGYVFGAFLAGYALAAGSNRFDDVVKAIGTVSLAFFIPIYFALVGYKLDFGKSFSFNLLAVFFTVACGVKLLSTGLGATLAGFKTRDVVNLSMALNARGGPGIVLASVAIDANIISAAFYSTLVLVAMFTSQLAGAWLDYVLRKGWPLLSEPQLGSRGDSDCGLRVGAYLHDLDPASEASRAELA